MSLSSKRPVSLRTALSAHAAIFRQDLRYAMRTMNRSRVLVATMIAVTALGVGANTATFSVADFVLLRPLPFPNPNELVRLCEGPLEGAGWGCNNELSPANFRDAAKMATMTHGWGAYTGAEANLVGGGEPMHISGEAVTPQVLPLLGVKPLLGRVFDTTAAGQHDESAIVLSYGLWQSQFGGRPDVLGQTLRLDDTPRVVIGVMPQGFHFPTAAVQLWTPLILREADFADRTDTYLHGIGRLVPGATFAQARTEIKLIFARMARENPKTNAETGFSFFSVRDEMSPRYRLMLLLLCGASLSLLLLTGANLANLFLARAAAREREFAVRAALGAERNRLVRQLLTESMVLTLIGGAAGVLVATLAVPLLVHLVPTSLPFGDPPRLDLHALLIAATFTGITGVGFGLIPAIVAGSRTGFRALREGPRGGGRRQRLRTTLVAIEVAVSVLLLVSSGFLTRAVWKVQRVDPGFSSDGVLTLRTSLSPSRSADSIRRTDFYDRVLAGVRSLPGVEAAAYTSGLPMVLTGGIAGVEVPGVDASRNPRTNGVSYRLVTPQFFSALRIPVLKGRSIDEGDRLGRPLVAVVSESFVTSQLRTDAPLGKTFRTRDLQYTVVGVVRDIMTRGLERTSEPQMYLAAAQAPRDLGGLYVPKDLIIRAGILSSALLPAVRDIVRRVDPEQPVSNVRLLREVVEGQTTDRRAQLRVLIALASIALLLTAIGIYGLLAYMVEQRSREIGVRLALGAEPAGVARMIVVDATRLALIGAIPGVLAAYAAARAMSTLLFGIAPSDPLTLGGGLLVVIAATIAGSLAPARSAVRVNPLVAMQAD